MVLCGGQSLRMDGTLCWDAHGRPYLTAPESWSKRDLDARPSWSLLGSDHLVLGTSLAPHSICGLSTLELGQGTRRGQQGEGQRPHLKHAFPPVSHVKCTTQGSLLHSWIRTSVTSVNFASRRDTRLCGYDSPRFPTPASLSHHQSTVRLQRAPHPGHLTGKEP